jgi:hypothetical protein
VHDPRLPATLADELSQLRHRLAHLERYALNVNGANTVLGSVAVRAGAASAPTVARFTPTGGVELPYVLVPGTRAAEAVSVTSGAFTTAWSFVVPSLPSAALILSGLVATSAATTGEVRILETFTSSATAASPLAAGVTNTVAFNWQLTPSLTLGAGPYTFAVQVRRLSGAGSVDVYEPTVALGVNTLATITGL